MATCLLSVTPVVPERLCLNIQATAETAARISTFLITAVKHVPACSTCIVTQLDLDKTLKTKTLLLNLEYLMF